MSPGRHHPRSNANAAHASMTSPQRFGSPAAAPQTKRQLGMSSAVYENNMRVLLRREPSITSIFDQFSHVCVYSYNGSKWERGGYEGSMFLFERKAYPPYGLFILNRTATDDYIQFIHPEDDIEITGDYVMYRYYPDFTRRRLELGLPYPIPPAYRAQFDHEMGNSVATSGTPVDKAQNAKPEKEKKGASVTLGLWMFSTDAREPLKDVIMRLHSYIKRGEPYPEEYRYGPGRPPPPNPHLRTASRASNVSSTHDDDGADGQRTMTQVSQVMTTITQTTQPALSSGPSELDKLFAKLIPSVPATPSNESRMKPSTTSSMSVQDLFAALGGPELAQPAHPAATTLSHSLIPSQVTVPAPPAPNAPTPNRGLALLDTIFASATTAPSPRVQQSATAHAPQLQSSTSLPSNPEEIHIVSPKPTSNTLPQILNQDVMSSLLGLAAGSRTSSAAPSSTGSYRSGANRYEGDNESSDSGDQASDGYSPITSVVSNGVVDPAVLAAAPSGLPSFSVERTGTSPSQLRRVEGDVTPRPPLRGFGSPAPQQMAPLGQGLPPSISAHANGASQSGSASPAPEATPAPRSRPLVPFQTDSDLWPYPRAPLDDRADDASDADVVELDFADTRALSDPAIFSNRLKEKQSRAVSGKKKTRKERAADREREREEIENGWDDPVKGQVHGMVHAPGASVANDFVTQPPITNGHVHVNEKDMHAAPHTPQEETPEVNGHVQNGVIDVSAANGTLVNVLSSHSARPAPGLHRNDFVRELLMLIHTDKAFVDKLWEDYNVRAS
ncbi:hypothetical protein CERSUDRAFT_119266 [Gelatoporia subvermispora B]|uniref:mRNA-decapping enzyme C-terminal domain-containing protein n=1 Tax=Ceriporiopsis subvermispora (strain B) TaxID=914234 RepID=M2P961_CERS8|nr:hypothetical protein CERSUDRAFT_119266 [Gelatoporia subvermispora B]